MANCQTDCSPAACSNAFDWLQPYPTVEFGVRVEWQLRSNFRAPAPLRYQLQVGRTGLNTADDWEDVGTPVTDGYYAYDDVKRVYGSERWTWYRVVLTDGNGIEHISEPINVGDAVKPISRNRIRGLQRYWINRGRSRASSTGLQLYVLKRRLFGTPCPDCLDYQTGESTDDHCPTCFGTNFAGGYFDPQGCFYGELQTNRRRTAVEGSLRQGTIGEQDARIRLLAEPHLMQNDVLVAHKSDERYYVHRIDDAAMVEGISVMVDVEVRLAPYSDIIYSFEIPEQVP